jgi:uncharacterized spore protein YtfJ
MDTQQLLESIAGNVKHVYGEPVRVGDRIVIPAARFRYGFGGGTRGGGGRITARPAGAIEITPEGTRCIAFESPARLGAALALGFVFGAAVVALGRRH